MRYLVTNKRWRLTEDYNIDKILFLIVDRPDEINNYDDFAWQNNKHERHRDYDLPAKVWNYGFYAWYIEGKNCRRSNKSVTVCDVFNKDHYL